MQNSSTVLGAAIVCLCQSGDSQSRMVLKLVPKCQFARDAATTSATNRMLTPYSAMLAVYLHAVSSNPVLSADLTRPHKDACTVTTSRVLYGFTCSRHRCLQAPGILP